MAKTNSSFPWSFQVFLLSQNNIYALDVWFKAHWSCYCSCKGVREKAWKKPFLKHIPPPHTHHLSGRSLLLFWMLEMGRLPQPSLHQSLWNAARPSGGSAQPLSSWGHQLIQLQPVASIPFLEAGFVQSAFFAHQAASLTFLTPQKTKYSESKQHNLSAWYEGVFSKAICEVYFREANVGERKFYVAVATQAKKKKKDSCCNTYVQSSLLLKYHWFLQWGKAIDQFYSGWLLLPKPAVLKVQTKTRLLSSTIIWGYSNEEPIRIRIIHSICVHLGSGQYYKI